MFSNDCLVIAGFLFIYNKKVVLNWTTFCKFWQGHKDLNPEPTVLETARPSRKVLEPQALFCHCNITYYNVITMLLTEYISAQNKYLPISEGALVQHRSYSRL